MLDPFVAGRDWLLADGAIGTALLGMGLAAGEAPELWNAAHPDRVRGLHQDFVHAGADIILTNTFGGNRRRLALHGRGDQARAMSRLGAGHARAVADAAARRVLVAGSVGPTGELLAPLGKLTEAEAEALFQEQITGLREGGADLAWIETMSSLDEMRAAVTAAGRAGLPCVVTASFDTTGRTMMGVSPASVARGMLALAPPPLGVGCNCGVGPAGTVLSVLEMTAAAPDAVVIAKSNCGLPTVVHGELAYAVTPAVMAAYACLSLDAGARIIGGCCGTSPAHLAAMRRALDGHTRGTRPERDAVLRALGPLAAPVAKTRARAGARAGGRAPSLSLGRP